MCVRVFCCQIFYFTNSWQIDCKIECDNFHFTFISNDNRVDDGGGVYSLSLYMSVYVLAIPSSSSSSCCDGRMDGFIYLLLQFIHFAIDHFQCCVPNEFQSVHFQKPKKEKKLQCTHAGEKGQTIDILLIRQCVKQKCSICNKFECVLLFCRYTHPHVICKYTEFFEHETQFYQITRSISLCECICNISRISFHIFFSLLPNCFH